LAGSEDTLSVDVWTVLTKSLIYSLPPVSVISPAGPGTTVKTVLTDAAMRRIAKLSEEDELFAVEEY
jgi:hypothetical protein